MASGFKSAVVDKRQVRYVCEGEGVPAVVVDQGQGLSIERGFGRSSPIGWTKVFQEVQKTTRIIMHDRAGLGSSDAEAGPRTSVKMVHDLRAVLAAAKVPPPYVLVGHSIGGFNVRVFAGRYPDEVAGMVLVDSSHPDQIQTFASVMPPETTDESNSMKLLRRGPDMVLSTEAIDFRACAEQARGIRTIGLKPLVIVSQSPQAWGPPDIPLPVWEKIRITWSRMQTDLLQLLGSATQVVATQSGHQIQVEEPALVVGAILHVLRGAQAATLRKH